MAPVKEINQYVKWSKSSRTYQQSNTISFSTVRDKYRCNPAYRCLLHHTKESQCFDSPAGFPAPLSSTPWSLYLIHFGFSHVIQSGIARPWHRPETICQQYTTARRVCHTPEDQKLNFLPFQQQRVWPCLLVLCCNMQPMYQTAPVAWAWV